MKHLLLTTIAAVLLVGCGNPEADRALIQAARTGNHEAVKQHLASGADVNATDRIGRTPLHFASSVGDKKFVEFLITKGADLNAKDQNGRTPLDWTNVVIGPDPKALKETRDLLRKHGGKTGAELKAEGK